jgi:hypothetical protein
MLVIAGLVIVGCDSGPRAPVLRDGPVYQNNREGFFFLVPDGWIQIARSELPSGKLVKERLLVSYRSTEKGMEFEVSMADLPEKADLKSYLEGPSFSVAKWKAISPEESVEIGGRPATRLLLVGESARKKVSKEVVYFRRNERVYFFTGVYLTSETNARSQIRQAVSSTSWK